MILRHMLNQSPGLDLRFHALADPAGRAMVERLARGPAPVSELAIVANFGGLEHWKVIKTQELFARHVMPAFR